MNRALIPTIAITAALGLAGCGNQTAAAATCLKNAIANQTLAGAQNNNCTDSSGVDAMQSGGSTSIQVSCTHQNANQYVCDVTSSGAVPVPTGFYDVTYDGQSIVYQRG